LLGDDYQDLFCEEGACTCTIYLSFSPCLSLYTVRCIHIHMLGWRNVGASQSGAQNGRENGPGGRSERGWECVCVCVYFPTDTVT